MARISKNSRKNAGKRQTKVEDYRHGEEKRKNIPPAKIAAEGVVPAVPKARYHYSPRRPPVLRFDPDGGPDKLPELIEEAKRRNLTADEANLLADALRSHEPWLEWAEKQEQHQRGFFEVDPVALHIHERVSAQAILKVARRQDVQRGLFADPEQEYREAVQFYRHDIDWANRLILGDSLQVMSSLAHRETLAGKVQMIYMDPPYGIKFASNFQPEIGRRDVKDKEQDLTREAEMVKAYRDTWNLGIHSYLSYLRERLFVAKCLLADSGSLFLQIGAENLHRARCLMDEVFGKGNFVSQIAFRRGGFQTSDALPNTFDFILWYAKTRELIRQRSLHVATPLEEWFPNQQRWMEFLNGSRQELEWGKPVQDEAVVHTHRAVFSASGGETSRFPVDFEGRVYSPPTSRGWSTNPEGFRRLRESNRLLGIGKSLRFKPYHTDYPFRVLTNGWTDTVTSGFGEEKLYAVQTETKIIERCMLMTTDAGDLVLDPTCGSATTARVAEQWGRRWITIDTSRVAIAIARQRLLTAKFERFRVKGEDEEGNGNGNDRPGVDPHPGFVCETVSHVTLKSIVQNQNLDPIFAKHEPILDGRLKAANAALAKVTDSLRAALLVKLDRKAKEQGKKAITDADRRRWDLPKRDERWDHWEVPFDTDPDWPREVQEAVTEYRKAWRAKMDEVNACIVANAEPADLVDQPEVIKGVVRVSGPFSVEAVQPPEMSIGEEVELPPDDGRFGGEPGELDAAFSAPREVVPRPELDTQNVEAYLDQMIRLLRMDGVRFPDNRQMRFTRLERLESSGPGLHAEGRWVLEGQKDEDPEGRAAVCVAFGPQYGPVTAMMVEDVVRSANRMGYDDLVVAGFSFDGPAQAVIEEAQHPRLRIHMAHVAPSVNPAMNGLLKEQPGSQLFTVFGQPRVSLGGPDGDGQYTVTMEGVDIYNPVENSIRSTGAEKVAAWFLDGDYNGWTFCITQAFFPDRSAWDKLARALKGVVDEEAFAAFSGTVSLPFPAGKHKCAAVKVIDPRGNEVMRVIRL